MARSLAFRLSVLQQVMAVTLILAFAVLAIGLSAGTLARQESSYLAAAAAQIADQLDHEWGEEHDLRLAAESVLAENVPTDIWVEVFDASGKRVGANHAGEAWPPASDLHAMRVDLAPGGWVRTAVSSRLRRQAVWALVWALALTAVPLLLASVFAGRALTRRTLRPLARLTEAAAAAGEGPRVLTQPGDPTEIKTLSTAFDRLLSRVHASLRAERDFSQDAAHELRTPLTVLSGELELALSDPGLISRHRHGLSRAAEQVRGMSELVEALLLLKRAEAAGNAAATDGSHVDLGALVRDGVEEATGRVPARAADVAVTAADGIAVAGNATLLAAAVRNLLANALKFTSPGQPVRVSVEAETGTARVVVEDGGPGVAPADRERIFDSFFRGGEARAQQEGVGLGLPILLRVARAHGGGVELNDSSLGGARFVLRLPLAASRR